MLLAIIRNFRSFITLGLLFFLGSLNTSHAGLIPNIYVFPPGIPDGKWWAVDPLDAVDGGMDGIMNPDGTEPADPIIRGGWFTDGLSQPIIVEDNPTLLCNSIAIRLTATDPSVGTNGFLGYGVSAIDTVYVAPEGGPFATIATCSITREYETTSEGAFVYWGWRYSEVDRINSCTGYAPLDEQWRAFFTYCGDPDNGQLCALQVALARGNAIGECLGNFPSAAEVCSIGNPVNVLDGSKTQTEIDYEGVGPFPIKLERYYDSKDGKWRHSYQRNFFPNLANGLTTIAEFPDGTTEVFDNYSNAGWVGSGRNNLTHNTDGTWSITTADDITETYDSDGNLISLINRNGLAQTISQNGNDLTVTDHYGRSITITENADGSFTRATSPIGTFNYNFVDGNLSKVTYPNTKFIEYKYEDSHFPHLLTKRIDENNDVYAQWNYNIEGKAISSEHGDNLAAGKVDYEYFADRTEVTIAGKKDTYRFGLHAGRYLLDSVDGGAAANCPLANKNYTYDDNGFKDTYSDWNDVDYDVDYNDRGLTERFVEAVGTSDERITETIWHTQWRLPESITITDHLRTTYTYTPEGRIDTVTQTDLTGNAPAERSSRAWDYNYTYYDADRTQLESVTLDGPRTDKPDITRWEYDSGGLLTSIVNGFGELDLTTSITDRYASGLPKTVIDENGVTSSLTYNNRQLLSTLTLDGVTTTFTYDDARLLTSIATTPNGETTNYEYDSAHRLTAIFNNAGDRIDFEQLDSFGNPNVIKNKNGENLKKEIESTFDALGRIWKKFDTNGSSVLHDYEYDANNNNRLDTDALLNPFERVYDKLNRVSDIVIRTNGTVQITYDKLDNVTSITDPATPEHPGGLTTNYTYDGFSLLVSLESPNTGTTTYTYDLAGNQKSQTNNGKTIAYTYDAINRIKTVNYPTDSGITYNYDATLTQGNVNYGKGKLTSIVQGNNTIEFIYAKRGLISDKYSEIEGATYHTSYAYDGSGNINTITYPSGRAINFGRSTQTRLVTGITTRLGEVTQTIASGVTYMPFGPVHELTWGNSLKTTLSYDTHYKITGINTSKDATRIQDLDYQYDDPRRLPGPINDLVNTSLSQSLGYDDNEHLETASSNEYGSFSFNYDDARNRQVLNWSQGSDSRQDIYTYKADSHHIDSLTSNSGTTPFAYTGAGATQSDGNLNYFYNDSNKLIRVEKDSQVLASYSYNPLGQRITKTVAGVTTHFHYDEIGQLIGETTSSGSILREFVYLDQKPIALILPVAPTVANIIQQSTVHASLAPDPMYALCFGLLFIVVSLVSHRYFPGTFKAIAIALPIVITGASCQGGGELPSPTDNGIYFIHTDHLGVPQVLTNYKQDKVWEAYYLPFGEAVEIISSVPNPLRYPGQYYDVETGLHYNWHRYYDPSLGRYLESDPIGLQGGLNTYAYALNNPLHYVDRFGLSVDPETEYGVGPVAPWLLGTWVHGVFTEYVLSMGYLGNITFDHVFGDFRPDVFDPLTKRVWELKPRSCQTDPGLRLAELQLNNYVAEANRTDPGWTTGASQDLLPTDVYLTAKYWSGTTFNVRFYADPSITSGIVYYQLNEAACVCGY